MGKRPPSLSASFRSCLNVVGKVGSEEPRWALDDPMVGRAQ